MPPVPRGGHHLATNALAMMPAAPTMPSPTPTPVSISEVTPIATTVSACTSVSATVSSHSPSRDSASVRRATSPSEWSRMTATI